jgi:hypothetical protein
MITLTQAAEEMQAKPPEKNKSTPSTGSIFNKYRTNSGVHKTVADADRSITAGKIELQHASETLDATLDNLTRNADKAARVAEAHVAAAKEALVQLEKDAAEAKKKAENMRIFAGIKKLENKRIIAGEAVRDLQEAEATAKVNAAPGFVSRTYERIKNSATKAVSILPCPSKTQVAVVAGIAGVIGLAKLGVFLHKKGMRISFSQASNAAPAARHAMR